ncbi:YwqG family protein [Ktedonosporobacter rubrisoli]|nr:YwqG family protein [Ktedonosporobacter rubrisoli]
MDKSAVQSALTGAGLAKLVPDIDKLLRLSIRLYATPVSQPQQEVGVSRLGGVPDLPSEIAWPQWKNVPQSFIAQIRLDDVHQYDLNGLLPAQGMLWFFYDAQQETFGEEPADRGGWQVFFAPSAARLQRATVPTSLPQASQFQACSLRFASELTLALQPQLEIANLKWSDSEQEQYDNMLSTLIEQNERAAVHHRLLGYPETLQDDMRQQCQLVSHGVTDEDDPRVATLAKTAMDWQLLLQIDSDEQAGMKWGNTGMLYYWITQADLQQRQFGNTWLILQSE